MGFFSEDKAVELKRLSAALEESELRRKRLAKALKDEQQKTIDLEGQVEYWKAEIERMKAALLKARQRQKASVDRANRYKSRLATVMTSATVNM